MSTTTRTCLVVEDESVIAMSIEMTLDEHGIGVAGPFSAEAEALHWLERGMPDIAIIDIVLADGECTALVQELRRRGVPLVIHSGLAPGRRTSATYDGLTWVEKPADHPALLAALWQVAPLLAPRSCGG